MKWLAWVSTVLFLLLVVARLSLEIFGDSLMFNCATDHQVRVWHATRYQEHWQSKTPWQTVIEEPSYDAAVNTAAERMHWPRDTFAVTPVTKDYVDQREIRYTP